MSLFGYGSAASVSRPSEPSQSSTPETPLLRRSQEAQASSPSLLSPAPSRPGPDNLPSITATGDMTHDTMAHSPHAHEETRKRGDGLFSFLPHWQESKATVERVHVGDGVAGAQDVQQQHHHGEGKAACELPKGMQTLVAPQHHAILEHVVVSVRDSADVTQKTIFYFWDEWKNFINRGNVVDLGIGIVIGGAFSGLIDSLVADILTPPLSMWAMGTNLENSFFVLRHGRTPGKEYATVEEAQADGAVTENTGHFIKACINFVFVAFCLFWVMKAMHNIRKEKIRPPPKVKTCNWCRESIALDAFRCRYCQSYVKDIPGLEDCGVGMFVTIKKPKPANGTETSNSTGATVAGATVAGATVAGGSGGGGGGGGGSEKMTEAPKPSLDSGNDAASKAAPLDGKQAAPEQSTTDPSSKLHSRE